MASKNRTVVELRAGSLSEAELVVRQLDGREALSTPYAFDLVFQPANGEPLALADLGGAEALLTLRRPDGSDRLVHGLLWSIELLGVKNQKPSYRARLMPRLERLRHVKRSRIFQAMSVQDIVEEVLQAGEVTHRFGSVAASRPRPYCVQYRESDLTFVSRLLEEEGIFYFFEHEPDQHTMVITDAGGDCGHITGDPAVPLRRGQRTGDAEGEEHLTRVEQVQRLRTGKVLLRDFDFERPELLLEEDASGASDLAKLEHYEYPGGFLDGGAGARLATTRLEALRREASTVAGQGTCLRFGAGATFDLVERDDGASRSLLLTAVEHVARQTEGVGQGEAVEHEYRNTFLAQDAADPVRPARRTRRPSARLETATVVGTAGEEIDTDKYGRVKVQFHWDRDGKKDEKSSCFIRCAQAWAGPAWGASVLPRLGQEVLVQFLDGDPDRPVIAGAVYNGQNPTPVQLPDDKTRSTFRTDSSLGGGGSNELRFEDLQASEEVYLHAQKDQTIEVENDKTQRVGSKDSLQVAKDRSIEVKGNQSLAVGVDDASKVDGNRTLKVAGDRETAVRGGHQEKVLLGQSVSVDGLRLLEILGVGSEAVTGAAALDVGAAYAVNVGGALNLDVGGVLTCKVDGDHVEVVGGARDETVGLNSAATVSGDFTQEVAGQVSRGIGGDHQETVDGAVEIEVADAVAWTGKEFTLEAEKFTLLVDGKKVLTIDDSGNVTLGVASLKVEADGKVTLKGSKIEKGGSGSVESGSAQVTQLQPEEGEKAFVELAVKDQDGNPVAGEWFRIEFPDGTVKEGRTDGSGKAWVPGPKEGSTKLSFPRLDEKAWKKA
jgi:type VI secretion system secreted protein VgrG